MISHINEALKTAVENGDVSGANVLVLHNGRRNLMRVCDDESMTSLFSAKGEYGGTAGLARSFQMSLPMASRCFSAHSRQAWADRAYW